MGQDEQKEEREVLESIFPDEITDLSDTSYRVSISLDNVSSSEDDQQQPNIVLTVSYPEKYPDVAPHLELSPAPDAPAVAELDLHADREQLLAGLEPVIEENLGMAMVFTLVSALKEHAEQLIAERRQAAQARQEADAARAEEEENRKFQGTTVTRESFLAWHAAFRHEAEQAEEQARAEKEADDRRKKIKPEERLTGKQLWERGLAGKVDEDDDVAESLAAITVSEGDHS